MMMLSLAFFFLGSAAALSQQQVLQVEWANKAPTEPQGQLISPKRDKVTAQIAELQEGLVQAKQKSIGSVRMQKKEYERALRVFADKNHEIERDNSLVASKISSLRKDSAQLREKASEIEDWNRGVSADLDELRANISIAQEFTDNALGMSEELLYRSPAMQVFFDLDASEANASKHRAREEQFDLIDAAAGVALLQVGTQRSEGEPQIILKTLLSSWDNLAKQQAASLVTLKAAFDQEANASNTRHDLLLTEATRLNATLASETKLNFDLSVAVKHLSRAEDELVQQRTALRQFALRIGGRPVPKEAMVTPPPSTVAASISLVARLQPAAAAAASSKEKKRGGRGEKRRMGRPAAVDEAKANRSEEKKDSQSWFSKIGSGLSKIR